MLYVGGFVVAKTMPGLSPPNAHFVKRDSLHTRMRRSIGRSTGVVVIASGAGGLVDTEVLRHAAVLFPFPMDATLVDVVNVAFSRKSPETVTRRSEDEGYGGAV